VQNAADTFDLGLDLFIAIFSPAPPKPKNDMNIFIDILGIAFSFIGVGIFKS